MEIVLAVATILGGITAVWFLYEKGSSGLSKTKIVFPESRTDFYSHYSKCIENAKREMWITSDGFNLRNQRSAKFAAQITTATKQAMNNGTVVKRVQIIQTMHLNWLQEIRRLLNDHPDNFFVWANRTMTGIPNVCVLDPDSKNCVSERMEHELGHVAQGSEAGTFVFYHGDKKLAHKTREMVQNIIEHPASVPITLDTIDALHAELFEERCQKLRSWLKSHNECEDLSASGVFDETVIYEVMRSHNDEDVKP